MNSNMETTAQFLEARADLEARYAGSARGQIPNERAHATKRFLESEAKQHLIDEARFRAAAQQLRDADVALQDAERWRFVRDNHVQISHSPETEWPAVYVHGELAVLAGMPLDVLDQLPDDVQRATVEQALDALREIVATARAKVVRAREGRQA